MICPQCENDTEMEAHAIDGSAFHACPACGGFWFRESEREEVAEAVAPDIQWVDLDFWKNRADFSLVREPQYCPQCRDTELLRINETVSDTTAATCPSCRGIWLEGGQIDRIVAAMSREADRAGSMDYVREGLQLISEMLSDPERKSLEKNWRHLQAVFRLLRYRLYSEHPKLVSTLIGAQKSLPL